MVVLVLVLYALAGDLTVYRVQVERLQHFSCFSGNFNHAAGAGHSSSPACRWPEVGVVLFYFINCKQAGAAALQLQILWFNARLGYRRQSVPTDDTNSDVHPITGFWGELDDGDDAVAPLKKPLAPPHLLHPAPSTPRRNEAHCVHWLKMGRVAW